VPRIRQQNSLRALLASLGPAALAVPDAVARALVPSADGVPASREQFASEAGDAVSPLTAARVLAGLIVNPLLSPERASRLALAPAGESLTLREVLSQLSGVWSEPEPSTPAERPLQRIAQRAVVEAAMRLAASDAAPEARAEAFAALEAIQRRAKSLHSSDPSSEAQVRLIERELAAFLAAPSEFKPRNGPRTPPGRPIGGAR
jgi:hypothetical protein